MATGLRQSIGHSLGTDIEAVFTCEGTDTIQSLIVGREITGILVTVECSRYSGIRQVLVLTLPGGRSGEE